MVAVLSSCNKNEIEPSDNNTCANLKLDVTVSYPGEQTKALIKQDWANEDQIKIWYDTNNGETPNLVIKYDGTGWDTEGTPTTPSASGTLKAVYSGNVTVAANGISYTYAGGTISFNISEWIFLTEVQVVVKDLDDTNADKYTLACDKFTPFTGYNVGTDAITATVGTKNTAVTGISNDDGVAFVFATAEYSSVFTDFIFTLTDNTSGTVVKKYTANNPLPENTSVIKAIKIAGSKFVATTHASSVAAANTFIGTNENASKSVELETEDILATDVNQDDNTIHFVLKTTSPPDLVSFALPDIPQDLQDNGCTGWTIEYEQGYPTEKVNVEASAGSNITILAPTSHVILTGASYKNITARTGYNTFVVPSGVTISNLTVEKGAVEIHGTVTALTVSPLLGEDVFFRSCEGLSQTVFDKIKGTGHNYIDPSYMEVQNQNGTWNIVLRPNDIPVTSVSLGGFPENNIISVGTSVTLSATVTPADATNKNLIWKSSNNAVAIVDQNGKVTGVAAGTTTITVISVDGSKKDSCTITVKGSSHTETDEEEDIL